MCNYLRKLSIFIIGLMLVCCNDFNKQPQQINIKHNDKIEVTFGQDFSRLVIVDSLGVTGADGVISFPLSNGTSVFMMGDSFLKPVINGSRDPQSKMINNTFIIVDAANKNSKSIFKGTLENPETMLIPLNENGLKEYYWPGHGFEFNGELHVFMSKFTHETDDTWGFAYTGTDYLKLNKETYKVISQDDFPYSKENGVHYGHSIIKEKNYTYMYGTKLEGENAVLHVARGVMDSITNKLIDFEFFNGKEWGIDSEESQSLRGIDKQVPEQFSVFKHKDTYILVIQERDLVSGNIYSYTSNSPMGPWANEKLLYHTIIQEEHKYDKIFTYNAMAHPQYIKDNKLLISYCVNSFIVPRIHENVDYYRPQFIWVPMEHILE